MNYLSLFSGIGGLDLGLDRAGMTCVGQVEIDPFCRRVLAKHWPEVPRHDDVRTAVRWWKSVIRPPIHAVVGGFPCQPVSGAGDRLGAGDERWLWPEMADIIAAVGPAWVIGENVPGLRTLGLDVVLDDLVRMGYRARTGTLAACEVGAPHPRERLFVLAPRRREHQDRAEPAGGAWWAVEPGVRRVAYGVSGGVDRRRALGNAVVPQVAEHIGRMVMAVAA